jgi:hypothetical protein
VAFTGVVHRVVDVFSFNDVKVVIGEVSVESCVVLRVEVEKVRLFPRCLDRWDLVHKDDVEFKILKLCNDWMWWRRLSIYRHWTGGSVSGAYGWVNVTRRVENCRCSFIDSGVQNLKTSGVCHLSLEAIGIGVADGFRNRLLWSWWCSAKRWRLLFITFQRQGSECFYGCGVH